MVALTKSQGMVMDGSRRPKMMVMASIVMSFVSGWHNDVLAAMELDLENVDLDALKLMMVVMEKEVLPGKAEDLVEVHRHQNGMELHRSKTG